MATVVAKYDTFVLVTNGMYKWSVHYVDLMQLSTRLKDKAEELNNNSKEECNEE
ncbi:hypothetical protein [Butyrivibrio sp. AE3004]|uniref:hypothetical protein n=1 Tax=Butyrivibrio sp. AE3004 TaxID=1506994 RepID=UPI000A404864|nr:hypothetical protein [Butyrivibrio sp. AE3004]